MMGRKDTSTGKDYDHGVGWSPIMQVAQTVSRKPWPSPALTECVNDTRCDPTARGSAVYDRISIGLWAESSYHSGPAQKVALAPCLTLQAAAST